MYASSVRYRHGYVRWPASFRPARMRKKPAACPPKLASFQASEGGSELTEKLGGNALREPCRRGQLRRNSFDAGHPQVCLFRQANEVRQDPHLLALALYLTEDDVAGFEGVADLDDIALIARQAEGCSI